jgi:hypothetical protein
MSLGVALTQMQPVKVFYGNITHNLAKMAKEVKLSNGMALYDVLWRPDEQEGLKQGRDVLPLLSEGLSILLQDHLHFKQFNPINGWGSYGTLVELVYLYRNACIEFPDAEIKVSR